MNPAQGAPRSCLPTNVVQSNTGKLFAADTRTGVARAIDLGGADVLIGDGILLRGRTLFVIENARFGTTDPQPAKYNVVRVP